MSLIGNKCNQKETNMDVRESWKRKIRTDLESYKDWPGEPLKNLVLFDRMIDLGFLPINSQEGLVSGLLPADLVLWRKTGCEKSEYKKQGGKFLPKTQGRENSERAYVTGFIPKRIATYAWYFANLTDKVCILGTFKKSAVKNSENCENYEIPVTYNCCFEIEHGGVPSNLPFPATRIIASGNASDLVETMKQLKKDDGGETYSFIQFFDPTHGRHARTNLFPEVIGFLQKSIESCENEKSTVKNKRD